MKDLIKELCFVYKSENDFVCRPSFDLEKEMESFVNNRISIKELKSSKEKFKKTYEELLQNTVNEE